MRVLVSVVIAGYNCAGFVAQTLRSVLAQTYRPLEVVFVDDGSRDATAEVVAGFAPEVRLVRVPHGGVSLARNAGIAASRGAYVALLDHDDLWEPEKIAAQVRLADQHPDVGLVFTRARVTGAASSFLPAVAEKLYPNGVGGDLGWTFLSLLVDNYVPYSSILVRRAALPEPPFRADLGYAEDYDLVLRVAERWRLGYLDEELTTYHVRPGSAASRRAATALEELSVYREALARNPWALERVAEILAKRERKLHLHCGYLLAGEGRIREAWPFLRPALRERPARLRILWWMARGLLRWRRA